MYERLQGAQFATYISSGTFPLPTIRQRGGEMTDLQTWKAGTNPYPTTHSSEREFEEFLASEQYIFTKEQDRFDLEVVAEGKTPKAVTPDYRIMFSPDGQIHECLFIELCEADRYIRRTSLPLAVQDKNRRHAASRKAYISPAEYLRRKRERMQKAEGKYGVVILVLTYADQQAVIAQPQLLKRMIDHRMAAVHPLRRTS